MSRPRRSKVLPFPDVPKGNGSGGNGVERRLRRLEIAQRETNRRLGRIETAIGNASKTFALVHESLEDLGRAFSGLIDRVERLEAGQQRLEDRVVGRLDRLIQATIRERTKRTDEMHRFE